MTDIGNAEKALVIANTLLGTDRVTLGQLSHKELMTTLEHVVDQHEAFRQEVSISVKRVQIGFDSVGNLYRFIIPEPKRDPLVDVLLEMDLSSDLEEGQHDAKWLRIKLDALGFEIREKNDG